MKKSLIYSISLLIVVCVSFGIESQQATYSCRLLSSDQVYDGDTLKDVRVLVLEHDFIPDEYGEKWPGVLITERGIEIETDIRINGIDTPEKRVSTKNRDGSQRSVASRERERKAAYASRSALVRLLEKNENRFDISNPFFGKYAGRIVSDMQVGGQDVAEYLIELGHAKPYRGGTKPEWGWGK